MRIVVVGGGKLGLPLAATFARNGAKVTVCDINPTIVDAVNSGRSPHDEPGLDELVNTLVRSGHLAASTDTTAATAEADAAVIIVSALLTDGRDIHYGNLDAASRAVAKALRPGMLVSYETTLPIGGCRGHLAPVLEESGLKAGQDFSLVFSPERVKSRSMLDKLVETPKVVGGIDAESARKGAEFYHRWLGSPVTNVDTLEAAELVKLAGMIYRDVNIAVANDLAAYAEAHGIDFGAVLPAANTDGETYLLRPSIGVGGHCTPVYPYFLIRECERSNLPFGRMASLARAINEDQPARAVARLDAALGGLSGKRVHLLGLAFRPAVKEDAMSPAYPLRDLLAAKGAVVTIEDPLYSDDEITAHGFVPGRAADAQAVVLHTAHDAFRTPDFTAWAAAGIRAVVDGQSFWSEEAARAAGLRYVGVGRPDRA